MRIPISQIMMLSSVMIMVPPLAGPPNLDLQTLLTLGTFTATPSKHLLR
jgi:hypothetical protein